MLRVWVHLASRPLLLAAQPPRRLCPRRRRPRRRAPRRRPPRAAPTSSRSPSRRTGGRSASSRCCTWTSTSAPARRGVSGCTRVHRVNRQRADGCFDGILYYGRAVAGVVPGYPAIPDPISSSVKNIDLQDWEASRWVQTKIAWSSLDFAGSTAVAANRLGPGAHPELNTGATGLMHHPETLLPCDRWPRHRPPPA